MKSQFSIIYNPQNKINLSPDVVLMSLLLTLNIYYTFCSVYNVDFKQVNVSWVNVSNVELFMLNIYVPLLENAPFYVLHLRQLFIFFTKTVLLSACSPGNYLVTLFLLAILNLFDCLKQNKVCFPPIYFNIFDVQTTNVFKNISAVQKSLWNKQIHK